MNIYGLYNNLDEYLTKIGDRNGDGIPHDCYLLSEDRQDTIVESLISPEPDDETLLHKWKDTEVLLEHFEIKEMIGKGAFGRVYLVQNCFTKRVYAMKQLNKGNFNDRKMI